MAGKALRNEQLLLYKEVPVLLQPPKRTVARALPAALHIGITATLSVLCFGVINAVVAKTLGQQSYWSVLIQKGTMMAMITVTVLAMPNLGNSVNKGAQRIAGVMFGGWLFFGLYAACQLWWFLVICLAVFAFVLVAASYALTGKQFLFPVALVTAFIVVTSFSSVQQAFVMTLVKTIAFSGAIALYTLMSILLFPQTATQQVINALADALDCLHKLAEVVLTDSAAPNTGAPERAANSTAAVLKDAQVTSQTAAAAGAGKRGKKAAPTPSRAAVLVATASHHLAQVVQLLPATRKERYVGSLGAYRCFLPSLRSSGLDEALVTAVALNASQVLRTLLSMALEFGAVPLARRPPPAKSFDAEEQQLVAPLAAQAAATLQDFKEALPLNRPLSRSAPDTHLVAYASTLQLLIAATLGAPTDAPAAPAAGVSSSDGSGATAFAAGAVGKWQAAAVGATGRADLVSKAHSLSAQQVATAFSQLLCDAVLQEEAQMAQWCKTLVLCRQLGKGLLGLNSSLNALLPVVPGAHQL